MKVYLTKLSICPCGALALKPEIPLNTVYEATEGSSCFGFYLCGTCERTLQSCLLLVERDGKEGYLPANLFSAEPILTSWFTFGQSHAHSVDGFTYDKDVVVEITAADPRAVMHDTFGNKWALEYNELPDLTLYPRGIKKLQ